MALVVLGLKYYAYVITGSVGLYSDALESVINVATAIAALIAVQVSAMPADANHPYGHSKAEYFSAVIEGVLIIVAAGSILTEAYARFRAPVVISEAGSGLLVNGGATVLNALWATVLMMQARRVRSPALKADSWHLFTDVFTSIGVVIGVGLAVATGYTLLDPLVAVLTALNIVWAGWRLMRESVGGLMDESAPPQQLERIRATIAQNADGAIEAHDLRTRHAGRMTFIEFHLVVPGEMPVTQAHDICDRIEKALRGAIEDVLITIHVEPENKAKHAGIVVL